MILELFVLELNLSLIHESNEIFAWHCDCSPKHKELAIKVEGITMDKVMEIWDNEGIYVLETIKTNTNKA